MSEIPKKRSVWVRNLDPETVERLKARAAENGRSLSEETAEILRDSVFRLTVQEWLREADVFSASMPKMTGPTAAEIIREIRDSH